MRALIQRVNNATVTINSNIHSRIEKGLLVFVGIQSDDNIDDIQYITQKISKLRIFDDNNGVMNLSVKDINGEILIVSQFTLHAMTKKGNRPSYINAAIPNIAMPLYQTFIEHMKLNSDLIVKSGMFGADMKVGLLNDGPVTIWIDSKNKE